MSHKSGTGFLLNNLGSLIYNSEIEDAYMGENIDEIWARKTIMTSKNVPENQNKQLNAII